MATYSKVESSEAGIQTRHNEGDKREREVCKISGGLRNPPVCLHLNGKDAEFGGRSDKDKARLQGAQAVFI